MNTTSTVALRTADPQGTLADDVTSLSAVIAIRWSRASPDSAGSNIGVGALAIDMTYLCVSGRGVRSH
jgi:hypothetical protein